MKTFAILLILAALAIGQSQQLQESAAISAACPTCIDALYNLTVNRVGLTARQDCDPGDNACGTMLYTVSEPDRSILILRVPSRLVPCVGGVQVPATGIGPGKH